MIFLVVIPVAFVGAYLVGRQVPADHPRNPSLRPGVDPAGLSGLSASLLLIFLAVTLAPANHWPWWGWLLVALGGLGIAVTTRWESLRFRNSQPAVIDITLFRQAVFRVGLGINSAYFLAFGGVLFVITFTLQEGPARKRRAVRLDFRPYVAREQAAFRIAIEDAAGDVPERGVCPGDCLS